MKNKFWNFIRLWGPVIIWYEVIFFLSNQPSLKSDLPYDFILRKGAHMIEFAILSFLIFNAIYKSQQPEKRKNNSISHTISFSFIISLLLATSDEIHQLFIKGRQGNYHDVIIDSIGMMITAVILKIRY